LWCAVPLQTLTRQVAAGKSGQDLYLDDDKLYSGWACRVFPGNDHRYRYIQLHNGEIIWQIGYYANGQRDHDFRLRDGRSIGHERMWMADGKPYILYYYSEPGKMHGLQRRWHDNGVLAWEAWYEHGHEISARHFDRNGNLTNSGGGAP
ncbi:MAG: hypothetical protein R3330_14365, partial [Saprospiraceae bacterium]|nr:hypothetical protein [Saprospiraceae bacterium]